MIRGLINKKNLPNVYFNKISVTENDRYFKIQAKVCLLDNDRPKGLRASWAKNNTHINNLLKIKCSVVFEKEDAKLSDRRITINKLNGGKILIPIPLRKSPWFIGKSKSVKKRNSIYLSKNMNNKYVYEYEFKFSIPKEHKNEIKNMALYAFTYTSMEDYNKKHGTSFNNAKRNSLRGSLSGEWIIKKGEISKRTNEFRIKDSDDIWAGPIHRHNNTWMAGSFHTSKSHPVLDLVRVDNHKLIYNDLSPKAFAKKRKPRLVPSRKPQKEKQKPKALYEYGLTPDAEENIQGIFLVDLGNLAIGKTRFGDKIHEADPKLHSEISDTLEISNISISRFKVPKKLMSKNAINLKLKNKKKHRKINKKTEKRIPSKRNLQKAIHLLKPKELISVPDLQKKAFFRQGLTIEEEGALDGDKEKIITIEEVKSGLDNRIKTIQFSDHELKNLTQGEYGYIVDIEVKDKYKQYVRNILARLSSFHENIRYFNKRISANKMVDKRSAKIKPKFIKNFLKEHGVKKSVDNSRIISKSATNAGLSNSFIIRGIEAAKDACGILNINFDEKMFLNKINPSTCTMESLQMASKKVSLIIKMIEKRYAIKYSNFGSKNSVGSRRPKTKITLKLKKVLSKTYIKRPTARIKYNFIKFSKKSPLKVKKSDFIKRANREVSKYFKQKPSTNLKDLKSLDSNSIGQMTNIEKNKYLNFTPEEINVGSIKIDTSSLAEAAKNNDLFNLLKVAKTINEIPDGHMDIPINMAVVRTALKNNNLIDASAYLGGKSAAVKNLSKIIKSKPHEMLKNKESLNEIAMAFHSKRAMSKQEISMIDFSKKENVFSQSIKNKTLNPSEIPLQIRSLILSRSAAVKNNILENKIDIFSNPLTSEMAHQNFSNIKKVQFFKGFLKNRDGLYDLSKPVFVDLDDAGYNSIKGSSKLCRMVDVSNNLFTKSSNKEVDSAGEIFMLEEDKEPLARKPPENINADRKKRALLNRNKNSQALLDSSENRAQMLSRGIVIENYIGYNRMLNPFKSKSKKSKKPVATKGKLVSRRDSKTKTIPTTRRMKGVY